MPQIAAVEFLACRARRWATASGLLILCLVLPASAGTTVPVIFTNQPDSVTDQRYLYPERLLQAILANTEPQYGRLDLQRTSTVMSRDRQFIEMRKGELLHVMAEAPKPAWEESLIPVRIPIRKGLQGYRLFLINRQDQDLLRQVRSLEDLRLLATGSGSQWSTMQVMQDAGFELVTSASYDGLFEMLARGRFRTFGRGLNEVYVELAAFQGKYPDLMVDEALVLYIPLPTYFFVTPRLPELARRIERGLNEMVNDGSFDVFFCEYHREAIRMAKLEKRRFFCISNPNLSQETPFERAELWSSESCGLRPEHRCLPP